MNSTRKHASVGLRPASAALLCGTVPVATAQTTTTTTTTSPFGGTVTYGAVCVGAVSLRARVCPGSISAGFGFNPPPCDFSDNFYTENGIDVGHLDLAAPGASASSGSSARRRAPRPRRTGGRHNCTVDSPNTRTNVRSWRPPAAMSMTAPSRDGLHFHHRVPAENQKFFTRRRRRPPDPDGGHRQPLRAYAALKQRLSNGTFALRPAAPWGRARALLSGDERRYAEPQAGLEIREQPQFHRRQQWQRSSRQGQRAVSIARSAISATTCSASDRHLFLVHGGSGNPGPVCGPYWLRRRNRTGEPGWTPIIRRGELNNQLERTDAALKATRTSAAKMEEQSGSLPVPARSSNGAIASSVPGFGSKANGSRSTSGFFF